ncbi:hypothetical protein DAI22_03g113501 [Oryza sativa Japonica Group]|nr:hypothetical protein DAI22_03g113501 [Oryza sativa Japonica Group]
MGHKFLSVRYRTSQPRLPSSPLLRDAPCSAPPPPHTTLRFVSLLPLSRHVCAAPSPAPPRSVPQPSLLLCATYANRPRSSPPSAAPASVHAGSVVYPPSLSIREGRADTSGEGI